MRYAGQNYELSVAVPDGPITPATLDALARGLRRRAPAHVRLRRRGRAGAARHLPRRGDGLVRKAEFEPQPDAGAGSRRRARSASARSGCRRPAASSSCPVYDRDRLAAGNRIAGPAIVEQMDATTVILPGMTARVEPYLNLILEAPMSAAARSSGRDRRRSDHRRGDRQRPRLDRRGDGRGAGARQLLDQHQGAARLLDGALRRRAATRSARPSTSRCISAASSASSRIS